ncbi:Transducin beta-like protein 2, partial [Zootermopsis nevadensis]
SKKKHSEKWVRDSKQSFSHPWLLTSLKGHSGEVLDMDFSSNGKFLATCAEDRSVLIWSTKNWNQKDHKSLRINIEFDYARFVKWSPDCKAFIIHKKAERVVEVYKVAKKPDGWISGVTKALTFLKHYEDDVVGLGIACNGKYIMSCSEKNELVVWDLKGEQLAKVDTYLMTTICAQISPCARFVVASGFAPDVKVWEVRFSKLGEFQQLSRAFELTGHSSGVYDVGFSADSSRMATVSKDGTWRAFNTKIEYEKGEDPHLLSSGKYNHVGSLSHLAMSPNGEVVVVASGSSLAFYSVQTGECDAVIDDIYSGPITCILFDSLGKYVLTGGEKHVRVFHNVTGYRTTIASIQGKIRQHISSAQKERMEQQIREAESFLKSIGERS